MIGRTLDLYRSRLYAHEKKMPEILRENANMVMEQSWYSDIQVRPSILYRHKVGSYGKEYDEIGREDIKFIHKEAQPFNTQQVQFYIEFKPHVHYPLGTYIDIPDEVGEMKRWLIVRKDDDALFNKYSILPCNYTVKWVYKNHIYECLCVIRTINSYSSGVREGLLIDEVDNRCKMVMPFDEVSTALYYDIRIIVSSDRAIPFVWKTTKIEELTPAGISQFTITQDVYDETTDKAPDGTIVADINSQVLLPDNVEYEIPVHSTIDAYVVRNNTDTLVTDNVAIIGKKYKFIGKFIDEDGNEIPFDTSRGSQYHPKWVIEGLDSLDDEGNVIYDYTEYAVDWTFSLVFKLNKDYYLGGTRFKVHFSNLQGDFESIVEMEIET